MQYAFRCKNCGHFETAANAGTHRVPSKCRICHSPADWEVLADCTPERLKELDVTAEKHTPVTPDENHANKIKQHQAIVDQLAAKETYWTDNQSALLDEYDRIDKELKDCGDYPEDSVGFAQEHERRDKLRQRLHAIECLVWTDRDAVTKAEHEAQLVAGPERRTPQQIIRHGRESAGTKQTSEAKKG